VAGKIAPHCVGWFTIAILKRVIALAKRRSMMPTHIRNSRDASSRRGAESSNAESGIATLWLVFYAIALGVAISSPLISRAIEFAALTAD
jgi:hypothetical protein